MPISCLMETPLGEMRACVHQDALVGLWFCDQAHPPAAAHRPPGEHPLFAGLQAWLTRYFAGENPPVDLPLSPAGTPFQRAIWEEIASVPYGETATYQALAQRYAAAHGRPSMSAQAVGGAVGRNPLGLLIPCHRIVGARGTLVGYAGGLQRKQALLLLERAGVPVQPSP